VGLPQGVDFQEKSRLIRCGVFGEGESCIAESMCLRAPPEIAGKGTGESWAKRFICRFLQPQTASILHCVDEQRL